MSDSDNRVMQLQNGFGIANLQLTQQPIPSPNADRILVKMEAATLNFVDLLLIKGSLNPHVSFPYIPIADGAGVIEQVGSNVTSFSKGDRVVSVFVPNWKSGDPTPESTDNNTRPGLGTVPGELADYKLFQAHQLLHSPSNLNPMETATLPVAALTAWNALSYGKLKAGDTVLLHGTGGVSIFALQFAKAQNATVIITSSSDSKLARAQQLGADYTINYKQNPNWESTVKEMTQGAGVDVVVETVGGQNVSKSLRALRMGGHISIMGLLSGQNLSIDPLFLLSQQATIRGMEVGSTENFRAMNDAIATHDIHPVIDTQFPFEDARKALEYLEQGQHFGKVAIAF